MVGRRGLPRSAHRHAAVRLGIRRAGNELSLLQALVLGLTQGLSEFFPISSSGHLILVPWWLGWEDVLADAHVKKTFDVALHVGSLVAVIVYFRRELLGLVAGGARALWRRQVSTPEERLAVLLAVATIPAAAGGFLFEGTFERATQPWLIAITLAGFGLVMLMADRLHGRRDVEDLGLRDAIVIGIAQAAALVPGVSRSGVTISAGVALGTTRPAAARFSFLLAVPVIAGAGAYKAIDLAREGFPTTVGRAAFVVGMAGAAVSAFAAVAGLIRFLRRGSLVPFVAYRGLVAVVVVVLIATGLRDATL